MHKKIIFHTLTAISPLIILFMSLSGCGSRDQDKGDSGKPAEVTNQVNENTLTRVSLTPEAESRLGIKTWKVELRELPKIIRIGGEVIVPPGS